MKLAIAATFLGSTSFRRVCGSYSYEETWKRQQQPQQSHQESDDVHHSSTTQQHLKHERNFPGLKQQQQLRRGNNGTTRSSSFPGTIDSQSDQQNQLRVSAVSDGKTRGRHPAAERRKNSDELSPGVHVNVTECDPQGTVQQQSGSDHDNNNEMMTMSTADIGILTCGTGRYCKESQYSSLGGVCVSLGTTTYPQRRKMMETNDTRIHLGGNKVAVSTDSNATVPGGSNPSLFETVTYACEMTDYCDCNGFDFDALEGTIVCTNLDNDCSMTDNQCMEEVELCYTVTSTLDVISPDEYIYTECIHYAKPYQQKVCTTYDTAVPTSCSIEFNNDMCQSCEAQLRLHVDTYERNATTYTYRYNQRCFDFDCTNIAGGQSGNSCDRDIATIGYNVRFGQDCDRCLLCGMGYQMTARDVIFDVPFIGEYRCGGLELANSLGFFDREFCPLIQEAAFGPCGCEPLFSDPEIIDGRLDGFPGSSNLSSYPSTAPSLRMSSVPSAFPFMVPSTVPSAVPSTEASLLPSTIPSDLPSAVPYWVTSTIPSAVPSSTAPSAIPPSDSQSVPPFLTTLAPALDYGVPCYICGDKDATFVYPDAWLILPEGVSSCTDFALEALGNILSEDYCIDEVQPRALRFCGCVLPVTSRVETSPHNMTSTPTAHPTAPPSVAANVDPEAELPLPEGDYLCMPCGPEGTVANEQGLIPLSNGATSCSSFVDAGLAGIFPEDYCRDYVRPLVKEHCGCIVSSNIEPSDSGGSNNNSTKGNQK